LTNLSNQNAVKDGPLALSIVAEGSPPLLYQWRRSTSGRVPAEIVGATNSTLLLANIQSPGVYSVIVRNPAGSIASSSATVNVYFITLSPDGTVSWGWTFTGATSFKVQESTNLVDWTTSGTYGNVSGFTRSIPKIPQGAQKFFRVVPPL